jgi:hypothetical protein
MNELDAPLFILAGGIAACLMLAAHVIRLCINHKREQRRTEDD